jgi:hypothetical protein
MNGNPYYVAPLGGLGLQPGMQAIGQGLDRRDARNEKAEQQERVAGMLAGARQVMNTGDPDQISNYMLENPQVAQAIQQASNFKSAATNRSAIESAIGVVSGQNPNAVEEHVAVIEREGGDPTQTKNIIADAAGDPERLKKSAWASLAINTKPEQYKQLRELYGPKVKKLTQATGKGMQGWSYDNSTGAFSLDPTYQEYLNSDASRLAGKEMLGAKDVSGINDKVSGLIKEAVQIRGAALDLEALASDASQPAVIAAIFKFMKALDPTSAVRENEVGMIEGAEGAAQGMANMYNRLMGQGGMSAEGFAEIVRTAKTLSNSSALSAGDSVNGYTDVMADNLLPKQLKNMRKRVPVQFEISERTATHPPQNTQGWGLQIDAQGNQAYVGPNGEVEEIQ